MKTPKKRLLAVTSGILFAAISMSFIAVPAGNAAVSSFLRGNVTVSSTVTIGGTGGTSTVSFVYPAGGLYEAPTAVINADGFSVPLSNVSHSYDPGIGNEDEWTGDATDPATGIEYTVSLMIVGTNGNWKFQAAPTVDGIE